MPQDFQRELMHVLTRDFRAQGFSFPVANGLAVDRVERRNGRSFDWRATLAHTPMAPTTNDERLLRSLEAQKDVA